MVIGLTRHLGLRAAGWLHSSARRALFGLRAGDHRATGTRARRALTNLAGFVTCGDTRRAWWYRGLQNILGHVGRCRALRLEHVATHVRLGWARGDTGL